MTHLRAKTVIRNVVEKSDGSPMPFIGLESIQSGTGRLDITELPVKKADDSLCHRPGDVLFSKLRPYLAKSILASAPGTGTGELLVLRPHSQLDSRFLFYVTLSRPWLEWAEMTSYGSKMPRTSWDAIGDYSMWIPSLEEQRRIADFLDAETARIDRLRRLTDRQSSLLTERLSEAMRKLTAGLDMPQQPTGVPWMPFIASSWRLGKVAQLFQSGSGTTPTTSNPDYFDGDLPWVNSADINDSVIMDITRSITSKAVKDFPALKKHPSGSLVIAMYGQGETKGRAGILGVDAYLNQACCALLPIGNVMSKFALYWFRAYKSGVVSLALGAGQPNLSQELIRDLRIPVPGLETQRDLVSKLNSMESYTQSQMQVLARRSELLGERRQALITAAVTGQFDVTTGRGADLS